MGRDKHPAAAAPPSHARAARLQVELLGFWHPGTGRGEGASADAVVQRDQAGLPFLPGRSVKGLLREAVRLGVEAGVAGLTDELETFLFGSPLPGGIHADKRVGPLEEQRYATLPGSLQVGSARLGAGRSAQGRWCAYARTDEGERLARSLVTTFSSTRLEGGVASDGTLRTIEVVVPVTLSAELRVGGEAAEGRPIPWESLDEAVQVFLRALGSHRNRGMGRCRARILPEVP